MVEFYLNLNKEALKRTEKEATDESINELGEDDGKKELVYNNLRLEIGEMYFDEEKERLVLNGDIFDGKEDLGYISSYDLPIDLDLVVDLVQMYIKKLNKLKTVLEATK
ncbi:MAG: hypothetical protein M0R17_05690 [Candidatus Omnitrophica bacterium]|jgi:stalled ribosome rescue protein Dom34|nr:hypothetical protein [Candidatus Omnitrophota bacterium]